MELKGKKVLVVGLGKSGLAAALFLRRFVANPKRWAHFDVYCWNPAAKPGRPEGGDIQSARLLYDLIEARAARGRAS